MEGLLVLVHLLLAAGLGLHECGLELEKGDEVAGGVGDADLGQVGATLILSQRVSPTEEEAVDNRVVLLHHGMVEGGAKLAIRLVQVAGRPLQDLEDVLEALPLDGGDERRDPAGVPHVDCRSGIKESQKHIKVTLDNRSHQRSLVIIISSLKVSSSLVKQGNEVRAIVKGASVNRSIASFALVIEVIVLELNLIQKIVVTTATADIDPGFALIVKGVVVVEGHKAGRESRGVVRDHAANESSFALVCLDLRISSVTSKLVNKVLAMLVDGGDDGGLTDMILEI